MKCRGRESGRGSGATKKGGGLWRVDAPSLTKSVDGVSERGDFFKQKELKF